MQVMIQASPSGLLQGSLVNEREETYAGKSLRDSHKAELEEKIRQLRVLMEQAAADENSFTSDAVVQISMKLDELINDYHQFMEDYKNKPK
jgi:archaellum component FlaC